MKSNRDSALTAILQWEGSDVTLGPSEPGGASKYGISVSFLSDYRKRYNLPEATIADVEALDESTARLIYSETLLDPIRFDEMPLGVDYRIADLCVNLGISGGATLTQVAIGHWPLTSLFDDTTLAAIGLSDPKVLIYELGAAWLAKKHEAPGWYTSPNAPKGFGHGWTNRRVATDQLAVSMIKQ